MLQRAQPPVSRFPSSWSASRLLTGSVPGCSRHSFVRASAVMNCQCTLHRRLLVSAWVYRIGAIGEGGRRTGKPPRSGGRATRSSLAASGSSLRLRLRRALSSAQVMAHRSLMLAIRQPPPVVLLRVGALLCSQASASLRLRGQSTVASQPRNHPRSGVHASSAGFGSALGRLA